MKENRKIWFNASQNYFAMDFKKEALKLLEENISNKNLIKHNLAASALMKGLAKYFNKEDEIDLWEIAGLVHDLDWEKTQNNPQKHALVAAEILKAKGFPKEVVEAVRKHNYLAAVEPPETLMEKALYYGEEMTGLVIAAALVLPSKKLSDLTPQTIINRFKEKSFARGVDRELLLKSSEELGISLEKLAEIALESMKEISDDLGL